MSNWSFLIYSVAKTFKSEPIKSKLLKTLPGLQKNQIWGIDVSGMFVGKKEITVFSCLAFGNLLLDLKMLLTWAIQICKNLCLVHNCHLRLPIHILIHENLHCQSSLILVMSNISNFFRRVFICPMMLPLTSQLQPWRVGCWSIAVFALFIKLAAQFVCWVCNKRLFLQLF